MKFKNIVLTGMVVAISIFFIACTASGKSKQGTVAANVLPKVINIGTQQIPDDERVAIAEGYFEKELGVKVNVIEFQAGDIRNAMVSGDIDFALLGSSSAALGIASGMDVKMIWVHEILGKAERLVAKNGSEIQFVSDLPGKKVATPFSSTSHYSLLKAMELNHVSEKDVTLYDMQPPDIYAAWLRGDIDAAYIWEPTLSELLKTGTTIISSSDLAAQGVTTSNVEIVRTEFAKKYPELVVKYLQALDRAVTLYRHDPSEAIHAVAVSLNITDSDSKKQMEGSIWLSADQQSNPAYLGTVAHKGHMVDSLKDMADFLYDQKSLASKPQSTTFEMAVDPSFVEKAISEK